MAHDDAPGFPGFERGSNRQRPTLEGMFQWIQDHTTLHTHVEFLYVVDGYEVSYVVDDFITKAIGRGSTVKTALEDLIKNVNTLV